MTGPSSWISVAARLALYLRDGFTCAYCGKDLHGCKRGGIGLDHLVARSHGGDHSHSNLVTVCTSCNSRRGNRPWQDYAPGGAQDRILANIAKDINLELAQALIDGYEPGWETW